MTLICLYDHGETDLTPLTDLRASFDLRTGALTTRDRADRLLDGEVVTWAGEGVRPLSGEADRGGPIAAASVVLCLSGRWLDPGAAAGLGRHEALTSAGEVLAVRLPGPEALRFLESHESSARVTASDLPDARVLRRPWDVIRFGKDLLRTDLDLLLAEMPSGAVAASVVGEAGVRVHPRARLMPGVVLDAEAGPIVIDAGAVVRPNACIAGPAYIGQGSEISAGAVIRGGTSIGPVCRVGGEVGGSTFQAYSNKSHEGYLGDSYLGEWVNLGAGTITSNLKNTYGPVRAQANPHESPVDTGLNYLGSIIGDHVKTAIGTRLLTGSVIHTGAMIALSSFAPKAIERFAFLTDDGAKCYDIERFLDVAQRVMQRRDIEMSDAYAVRLRELHDL